MLLFFLLHLFRSILLAFFSLLLYYCSVHRAHLPCSIFLFPLYSISLALPFYLRLVFSTHSIFCNSLIPLFPLLPICLDVSLLLISLAVSFSFYFLFFPSSAFFLCSSHLSGFKALLSTLMPSSLAECCALHWANVRKLFATRLRTVCGRSFHDRREAGSKFALMEAA